MTIETGKIISSVVLRNKQWTQWLATITASIAFFTTGMLFAWSSPSLEILMSDRTPFNVTSDNISWIAALLPLGSVFGPIFGASMARYLGPKQTVISSSIPFLIGFILIIFATSPVYIYFSRFLSGIGVGVVFSTIPNYIAEIAENHNRGSLLITCTAVMHIGSLAISCFAPYISLATTAEICCVFPILTLALFSFIPDSPYYLMRIGKEKESIKALQWFRQQSVDSALQPEIDSIKKCVEKNCSMLECLKLIKERPNPKALMIVMFLLLAQQLSGAVAVGAYLETIFKDAQVPMRPEVGVMIATVIGNLSTFVSIFLVDRLGRKPLLIISSIGCGIASGVLGVYFHVASMYEIDDSLRWLPAIALFTFPIAFAFGLLSLPYTILSELFSSDFKEVAIGLVSIGGAILSTAVTKLFLQLSDSISISFSFFLLAGSTFLLMAVNYFILPETKNKTPSEIQTILLTSRKEDKQ